MTYTPPKVWTWNAESGGQFANINRPISGATHDKELPQGEHDLQLYSLATPNGVKVTVMLEELLEAGHDAEYDAYLINIQEGDQFSSGCLMEYCQHDRIGLCLSVHANAGSLCDLSISRRKYHLPGAVGKNLGSFANHFDDTWRVDPGEIFRPFESRGLHSSDQCAATRDDDTAGWSRPGESPSGVSGSCCRDCLDQCGGSAELSDYEKRGCLVYFYAPLLFLPHACRFEWRRIYISQ